MKRFYLRKEIIHWEWHVHLDKRIYTEIYASMVYITLLWCRCVRAYKSHSKESEHEIERKQQRAFRRTKVGVRNGLFAINVSILWNRLFKMDSSFWAFASIVLARAIHCHHDCIQIISSILRRYLSSLERERERAEKQTQKIRTKDSFNCCFFTRNVLFWWWLRDNMHIYNLHHHIIKAGCAVGVAAVAKCFIYCISVSFPFADIHFCALNKPCSHFVIYVPFESFVDQMQMKFTQRSDVFTFWLIWKRKKLLFCLECNFIPPF